MASYLVKGTDGAQFAPIPRAPLYVLSEDRFMSGLGHAQGKVNVCVCPVPNMSIANEVDSYLRFQRTDQKRIRIVSQPPRAKAHVLYSLVIWPPVAKLTPTHA